MKSITFCCKASSALRLIDWRTIFSATSALRLWACPSARANAAASFVTLAASIAPL